MEWLIIDQFGATRTTSIIVLIIIMINFLLAIGLIFLERRSAQSVWAWVLVLFFLPILGFILYIAFGRTIYKQDMFKLEDKDKVGLEYLVQEQLEDIQKKDFSFISKMAQKHRKLVHMLLYNNQSFLTSNNSITTYVDINDKFEQMLEDIKNAKDHIHFQYYIFRKDGIGTKLYKAMLEKQKEGVQVRILYDDMGSRALSLKQFKELKSNGGMVEAFFPSFLTIINPRINNRNHRKIVVIDGKIGYTGGANVGDDYIGLYKKFGHWRDTHLRIEGNAVKSLQLRFMLDWNSHSKRNNLIYEEHYFPTVINEGTIAMQIATSGPDEESQQIKYGYLKMIYSAKKSIYIQSPYFIPDESVREALRIALLSGIEVHLMIPDKPDHPFVYWGTYSNAGALVKLGAKVHIYENGFLHQKVVFIDDELLSIGTTNIDNRSFLLNFEINAFIYNQEETRNYRRIYEQDVEKSSLLTEEIYESRSKWIRMKEGIANLISPIL